MAGKNILPSTETEQESASDSEQGMSEDELNAAISEADPGFFEVLDKIHSDKSLSIAQFVLPEGLQGLKDEKAEWASSQGFWKILYRVFPLAPYVSFGFKKVKLGVMDFLRVQWIRLKNFLYFLATDGKAKTFGKVRKLWLEQAEKISESQRNFRYLHWKLKAALFGIFFLAAGTIFFIYRSLTQGVIPVGTGPFLTSLENVASQVYEYDRQTELEPFYENLRVLVSMIQIPKMVVNIQKSAHSGDNPMAAFEFYLEGQVPEVALEIKEREVEIRDRIQRVIETFSFDQLESMEGKKLLVETIEKEVSGQLTSGKLKKVWIKTVILKP